MADAAKVRLVGIEGSWSLAAITYELSLGVGSADSHHHWMAVGAPDALAGTIVATATPSRTSFTAIAGSKEDQDALIDGFDNLAGEDMIGISGSIGIPSFLIKPPAIGQDVRRAIGAMLVDRPLIS